MNFHETHASLPITRAGDHKRVRLKVEEGVRLDLEARRRSEENDEHVRLDSEEEACLVGGSKQKSEEDKEDYAHL